MHKLSPSPYVSFRMRMVGLLVVLGVLSFSLPGSFAQEKLTEHTLSFKEGSIRDRATIEDLKWLAGSWVGQDDNGLSEEIWSEPRAGSMVGTFRMINKGKPVFYELMFFFENQGSLLLRLKHFSADLTAWEDKKETVDFPLISKTKNAFYFDRITYSRDGKNGLKIFLAERDKNGRFDEQVFTFKRLKGR